MTNTRVPSIPYGALSVTHLLPCKLVSNNLFMDRIHVIINVMATYRMVRLLLN